MQDEMNGTDPFPEMNPTPEQAKFCQYCGNKINAQAKFCPHCGASLQAQQSWQAPPPAQNIQYSQPVQPAQTTEKNTIALVGFILSFFVPLAGLICSIIGLNKVPLYRTENSRKGLAIAGIVISAVNLVLSIIIDILWSTVWSYRIWDMISYWFE